MAKNRLSKLVMTEAGGGDYPSPVSSGKSSEADQMRQRRYRAEDALRTLIRAEEIKRDGQLMADIKVVAAEQAKALSAVEKKSSGR